LSSKTGKKKAPLTNEAKNEEEEEEDEVVAFSVCMLVLLMVSLVFQSWSLKNALGFPLKAGLLTTFSREICLNCNVSE
jgi:hypothetical protein